MVSYLCGICEKTIDDDKEFSILCDICNSWIHPKCNHLNFLDFQHISGNNNDPWFCFKCTCKTFPFGKLNNQNFHSFIHNNSEMNESSVGKYSNDNSILNLNPPPNLKSLFNKFNELTAESDKKNLENFINCKNLDVDEIQKMKIEPDSLSLFHINTCSLKKNFEDLEYLLKAKFLDFQHISGNNNDPWFCFKCACKTFPFANLNNQNFHSFIHSNSEMNESSVGKYSNDNNILKLNPPPNLKLLFNQFNELTAESDKKNLEDFINCKNLDVDEIRKMKIEPDSLSLFHINSCSLNKKF